MESGRGESSLAREFRPLFERPAVWGAADHILWFDHRVVVHHFARGNGHTWVFQLCEELDDRNMGLDPNHKHTKIDEFRPGPEVLPSRNARQLGQEVVAWLAGHQIDDDLITAVMTWINGLYATGNEIIGVP